MGATHDSVDFWGELAAELEARSKGRHTLAPVRATDTHWLRRAEPSLETASALAQTLKRHDPHFHHVIAQGKRCTTSKDLRRTLGDALEFPGYYGMNWGAFHECLYELLILSEGGLGSYFEDRAGRRAQGLVITVADAEHLLEEESRSDFESFLNLLQFSASASTDPADREIPHGQLFVLFSVDSNRPSDSNYHLEPHESHAVATPPARRPTISSPRRSLSSMPTGDEPVDLWAELEVELEARSEGRYTLGPPGAKGVEWLRQAEPSPEVDEALAHTLERHDSHFHHVIVQGKRCSTSTDLLRTLGDALEFPSYYGMNWDALDECLYELLVLSDGGLGSYYGERMGRRARSLVVTVADAEHLLANEPPRAFETFLDIFGQIASRPADPLGRDIPRGQLFVLFSVDPTNPPGPHHHLSA